MCWHSSSRLDTEKERHLQPSIVWLPGHYAPRLPLRAQGSQLFGAHEERRGPDAEALREREQQIVVRVQAPRLECRDPRFLHAGSVGQFAGAEAVLLADLPERLAQEQKSLFVCWTSVMETSNTR